MANKLKWINHKSTFFEILKAQREESKYTDATLAVDGKFYPVHKLVMSTCSEYFSEIFEKTTCKSPVIVLKDVQNHDIEALLDYIYVGEVDVKQDDLASLLKTAECLRIKGLGVPDERHTKSHINSINSDDVACARPYSPPPKRRRHDSNGALFSLNQSPHTPPNISSNTNQEDESFIKVEVDDSLEEEVQFRKENRCEADIETVHDPGIGSGYDIPKKEHNLENYDCALLPGPSSQQFTCSASDTRQKESLIVKVGLETAKDPELRYGQKHNYEGGASNDHDPLGGNNGSIIFNTEHNQEYYGSTSLPGSYLQQSLLSIKRSGPERPIASTTERLEKGDHFPDQLEENNAGRKKRKRCKVCNYQTLPSEEIRKLKSAKLTDQYCTLCNVSLCSGLCWRVFHTVRDYTNYNKKYQEMQDKEGTARNQNMSEEMSNIRFRQENDNESHQTDQEDNIY